MAYTNYIRNTENNISNDKRRFWTLLILKITLQAYLIKCNIIVRNFYWPD